MISGKLKKMIDRFVCDLMSNNDAAGQFAFVDIDTTTDRIHDSTYRKSSFQEKKGALTVSYAIWFSLEDMRETIMTSVRPQREQNFVLGQETIQLILRI